MNYLKMLVEDFHSAIVATIGADGHPQTRVIDIMLWDDKGIYFLTAKGKAFYAQIMEQGFVAISAAKDKRAISLRGKVQNIGNKKLDEIFDRNTYMQSIYPGDTRAALEVFWLYDAVGEYFDISDPAHIVRNSIVIGRQKVQISGYFVTDRCTGCRKCLDACPQKCIGYDTKFAVINQKNCLHCGRCMEVCPEQAIERRG